MIALAGGGVDRGWLWSPEEVALVVRGDSSFSHCRRRCQLLPYATASFIGGGIGIGFCQRQRLHLLSEAEASVIVGGSGFIHRRKQQHMFLEGAAASVVVEGSSSIGS